MKNILLFCSCFMIFGCVSQEEKLLESVILAHGSNNLENSNVSFDFRDYHYELEQRGGNYKYSRSITDSLGIKTLDQLSNDGFTRMVNDESVSVPDSMASKYSSSINSVAYFFLLPKTLKDPSVQLQVLEEAEIKEQKYDVLKVTFTQEGGGKDFEDEFRYWINSNTKEIDFLAYNYRTNGGGIRFREAFNKERINGVLVADYRNYGFESLNYQIDDLPKLWEENKIPLLSTIENKNVEIDIR